MARNARAALEDRLNVVCGTFGSRTDYKFEIKGAESSQQCVESPSTGAFDIRDGFLAYADFCCKLFLGQPQLPSSLADGISELKRSASDGFQVISPA